MAKHTISTSPYLLKILEEQMVMLNDLMARVSIVVSAMKGTWRAIAEDYDVFIDKDETTD